MTERTRAGKTDLRLFPVILGTVNMGRTIGDREADAILRRYMELGGNALDTARLYADGESERLLGRWFAQSGKREELILITKGGHPRMDSMHTGRMNETEMRRDLEESLRALKTDHIDLYFFHRDDLSQSVAESLEIMEQFVQEGKIRWYGCSNWTAVRIREALDYSEAHGLQGFAANQMLFNLGAAHMKPFPDDTMCTMDDETAQLHRERSILCMPYFSVCSGFFHKLRAGGEEAVRESPYYSQENLALARQMFHLAEEYHTSVTNVLLRFFFAQDFDSCPLYGPSRPEQLEDLQGLFELTIPREKFELP